MQYDAVSIDESTDRTKTVKKTKCGNCCKYQTFRP